MSESLIVTVDLSMDINLLAEKLKQEGFIVDDVFDTFGVIAGSAESNIIENLRNIPGVKDISPNREVGIFNG